MFNKVALLFFAFVASTALAAPIPDVSNDILQQCIAAGGDAFDCAQESEAPPTCNKDLITSNLATLQQTVQDIQNVGLVSPDPLAADQGGATLSTIVTALNAADTANTAGDFATVASNLQTIVDTTNTFLGPLLEDGLESGDDLTVNETAEDTLTIAQLCASSS
ncbi:hypothetical protein MSAN_02000000 [Mycena sanguinolenta]|uniref:Uncharacterized protein n=1 Tax=Mycena sanguinolenta TaxID=230812 RepID=A0A8H6XLI4_9AGAR|nr:hypothetical protein MSAN_02000000 [Mycena sanguinolenta]